MSIKVKCPGCTKTLTVPDAARGKAVKCPSCETRVSVPAGDEPETKSAAGKAKKPGKKPAPIQDESGLAGLDLGKVADHDAHVCPKCGYDLDLVETEEDEQVTECPQCGWDIEEGGMGAKAKKRALKGPDPDKFYPGLWKNSWKFVGENLMMSIRTFLYVKGASLVLLMSVFMYLWVSMWPPRYLFFAPLAFVSAMMIPGWFWFLDTETIKLTLERRDRFKRVNFDFFLSSALGVKFVLWNYVFAGPLLLLPAIIGWALWAFAGMPWWIIPTILAVCYIPIIGLWPVVLTHMTMPIQMPGWMFWKMIPIGLKCFKPLFWWFLLFSVTNLPIVLILGVTAIFTAAPVIEFAEIMETNAYLNRLKARTEYFSSAKNKPDDLLDVKAPAEFSQVKEFKMGTWHKQPGDEVHLYEAMYDYTDKEGASHTYRSSVRGKLDTILAPSGQQVAAKAPVAAVTMHQVGASHFIAIGISEFAWLVSCIILALTSLFNMRTNGHFAYFFREHLDLQVLIKEYKYVATISRETEKKKKSTGDVVSEAAVAVLIFMIMGVIFGLLYGTMSDFGTVNGLVAGMYYGAGVANLVAGWGLIIAAFGVSPAWGLMVFFSGCMCGIPVIFFLIQEWEDAKPHFFQWLFALLVQLLLTPIMLIMGIGPYAPLMERLRGEKAPQNQQGPVDPAGMPGGPGAMPGAIPGGPAGAMPGGPGAMPAGAGAIPGGPPGAVPPGAAVPPPGAVPPAAPGG